MRQYLITLISFVFFAFPGKAQVPSPIVPDFHFLRLNEQPFTQHDLQPREVSFFFFFDPGCEHCQRTMKRLDQDYKAVTRVNIYLVSMETVARIQGFLKTYAPHLALAKNVVVLRDNSYQFISKFKPRKYPALFLYGKQRNLLQYEDEETGVGKFFDQVKAYSKSARGIQP